MAIILLAEGTTTVRMAVR